ncbi:MAG: hypothetical protein ACO20H_10960 [Bacteriovoracaceae bacterium]
MLIRLLPLLLILLGVAHSYEIDQRLKSLSFLIDQKYQFYGYRNGHFYKIGDGWIKKVEEDEVYSYKFGRKDEQRDKKKLITALYSIVKSNRDLYISKNDEVFLIRGSKVVQIYPLKSPEQEWLKSQYSLLNKEKDYQRKIEISLCTWCQFSLSANYVNLQQDSPQASAELNWLPYFKWGESISFTTPIGLSNYLIEDETLNDSIDYALKIGAHLRYNFDTYFLEAGIGHFMLINNGSSNSMTTFGLGRYFQSNVSLFTKGIDLNYLFFHYSKINWLQPINEYKFGAGISF